MFRRMQTYIGAMVALSAIFDPAVSYAQQQPLPSPRLDRYGIELPRCLNASYEEVDFLPKPHSYFVENGKKLVAYVPSDPRLEFNPIVFYDQEALRGLKVQYRYHVLYTECARLKHASSIVRGPEVQNKPSYDPRAVELMAECASVRRLRDDKKFTSDDLLVIAIEIGKELDGLKEQPPAEYMDKRFRNLFACFRSK
jgi:hypothetical protein